MPAASTRPPPAQAEAGRAHLSDSSIQPFLHTHFDPADYLNSTLPALSTAASKGARAVQLPQLSAPLQALVYQLNAQTSRLSHSLAQLTDEIVRSGSRLAYEVEVLKSEAAGLADALQNGLRKDIVCLAAEDGEAAQARNETADAPGAVDHAAPSPQEPEPLQRLRTLTTVRERLDAVIKAFGSAMQWPVAPSELSLASSLISVSAPESTGDNRSREDRCKEYAEKLKAEINDLLATGVEGVPAANSRIEELRALAGIWKGTAEEKARTKLVDSLQRLVDDRQKTLGRPGVDARESGVAPARGMDYRYGGAHPTRVPESGSGYGFLQNLRNLTNEVYLDN